MTHEHEKERPPLMKRQPMAVQTVVAVLENEMSEVHLKHQWTLEHLSRGHGEKDDAQRGGHDDCAVTAFALTMNVSTVKDDVDDVDV